SAGSSIAARMAMMAITTSSSIRVKAHGPQRAREWLLGKASDVIEFIDLRWNGSLSNGPSRLSILCELFKRSLGDVRSIGLLTGKPPLPGPQPQAGSIHFVFE